MSARDAAGQSMPESPALPERSRQRRVLSGFRIGWGTALFVAATVSAAASIAFADAPPASLRVIAADGRQVQWWNESHAPVRWRGAGVVADAVTWRRASPGVAWGEVGLRGAGEATALKLVVVRIDPRQVQFSLRWGVDSASGRPAWNLADAPADAIVAVNAGMFVDALPWGWVVNRGGELLPQGRGALASAVIVTRSGNVVMASGDAVGRWQRSGEVVEAFQTYPTLLAGEGEVPVQLHGGDAIDLHHRDARLAIGLDRDGQVLIVLTRLDVALPALDRLPVGLTVPEMAAVMGSLGAREAALLDGGISAQLRVRDASGDDRDWKGMRQVPLGLIVRPR